VLTLPDAYKTKTAVQKSLLVESLHDLLPSEIIHRKKMGFVLPWEQWLKNELATYVQDAIQTLQSTHLLNAKEWQSAFDDFKRGRQSYNWNIFWGLIVLTKWLKNNKISSN
jgi:asparagine synthase (glutamine-hydrolysing)